MCVCLCVCMCVYMCFCVENEPFSVQLILAVAFISQEQRLFEIFFSQQVPLQMENSEGGDIRSYEKLYLPKLHHQALLDHKTCYLSHLSLKLICFAYLHVSHINLIQREAEIASDKFEGSMLLVVTICGKSFTVCLLIVQLFYALIDIFK